MGRLFQLFGMVDQKDMADEFAKLSPQNRQAEIDKLVSSANTIGIYSPETFSVMYRKEIVTIKSGWHEYSAGFAVWALQKYGKGSKYGKTYRTDADGKMVENPELLDEAPDGVPAERKARHKAEAE